MAANNQIVAIGLLTQQELEMFGASLAKVWPIDEAPIFSELLLAIDAAEANANVGAPNGEAQRNLPSEPDPDDR